MRSQTGGRSHPSEIALVAAASAVQLYISPPAGIKVTTPCPVHNKTQPSPYRIHIQPVASPAMAVPVPGGVSTTSAQSIPHASWGHTSMVQNPSRHGLAQVGSSAVPFSSVQPRGLEQDVRRYLTSLGGSQVATGYCAHQVPSWEMQDMVTRTLQSQGLYRFDPNQFSYGLWSEANRQYWWLRQQEEFYKQQQQWKAPVDADSEDEDDEAEGGPYQVLGTF